MDRVGTDPEHQVDTGCVYTDPDNQYQLSQRYSYRKFEFSTQQYEKIRLTLITNFRNLIFGSSSTYIHMCWYFSYVFSLQLLQ